MDGLNLQLYLRPLVSDLPVQLSLFVHLLDADGGYVFGRDFLGAPPTSWDPNTVLLQDNYLPVPHPCPRPLLRHPGVV
ncbi:MAG: hypothetical protein HC915_11645 [Anaerolineae bacterium]|nr:hypothetical protein [Anaerolineae bacterium]